MNALAYEIQNMNSQVKLVTAPRWLTHKNVRTQKENSSVVIVVKTQEQAKALINRGVWIDNEKKTATMFIKSRPYDRYSRCQGYGHNAVRCTRPVACRVCAADHETKGHFCRACGVTAKACAHIKVKCANCKKDYEANNI